jgi:single-stranded DNA-specific DHH superfamily exonuclease
MTAPEIRFAYTVPQAPALVELSHAEAERARRTSKNALLPKQFATMFADQLKLAPDSLLRRDIIEPMEYDDVVPQLQAEMALHIKDFSVAAEQICNAIREGKIIGISSDYDADGNTSLALFIRLLRACGVPREKIITHIPNREEDGYGVNEAAVDDFAAKHVDVMITLDNGTRAEKPIKKALAAGIEVVVIDHHGDAGGKALPPEAKVVNSNILANQVATKRSPQLEETRNLAAVGVSYMMAAEVMDRMNASRNEDVKLDPKPLLGLVALGTVSDVVKMGWLNRVLVRAGLQQIRAGEDKNILRFMRGVRILNPTDIDESTIAFKLGPVINASGRLGNSVAWAFLSAMQGEATPSTMEEESQRTVGELREALESVKSPAQKEKEARSAVWRQANPDKVRKSDEHKPHPLYNTIPENPYLDRLIAQSNDCNELRKDIEFAMRDEIRRESSKQTNNHVRLIAREGWHEGVIGIAASRVKEEFDLPAVVGSIKQRAEGIWQAKFSARSIRVPGYPVDIGAAFAELGAQHEHDTTSLLAKAGGHPMAAGATIFAKTRDELDEKINRFSVELNERLGSATERALAHREEQVFGTLDLSAITINANHGEGSLADRVHRLLEAIPQSAPFGEGMRAPQVAIRGVGIYPPQTGSSQSRRGHLNFDILGGHNGVRVHCRASHAGGTALGDAIAMLQAGAKQAIVVGELRRKPDGSLQMEVSHVLPDRGLASDPTFTESGIFSLVGLGRGRQAMEVA